MQEYKLLVYRKENGRVPYDKWFTSLGKETRFRIETRIDRLETGHFGDYKNLGNGLFELRFNFAGGIRIYFSILSKNIILLLLGGTKAKQNRDIKTAKSYLLDYKYGTDN